MPPTSEQVVCSTDDNRPVTALDALPADVEWTGEVVPLEPVDELSVLIHPEFWSHRHLAIPGGEPVEIPTTSRSGLEGAGWSSSPDAGTSA
jgi:hypothetical protein